MLRCGRCVFICALPVLFLVSSPTTTTTTTASPRCGALAFGLWERQMRKREINLFLRDARTRSRSKNCDRKRPYKGPTAKIFSVSDF